MIFFWEHDIHGKMPIIDLYEVYNWYSVILIFEYTILKIWYSIMGKQCDLTDLSVCGGAGLIVAVFEVF